jgi:hypothetical protein
MICDVYTNIVAMAPRSNARPRDKQTGVSTYMYVKCITAVLIRNKIKKITWQLRL